MVNLPFEINRTQVKPWVLVTSVIKVARPFHWTKNLAIFAALIFTGTLFIKFYFVKAVWAFVAFCLVTSATYIFNDLMDAKLDRLHPIKKERPIAKGTVSAPLAFGLFLAFAFVAIYIARLLNPLFSLLVIAYLAIQITYSLGLKNLAIIDILIVASGFIIRVYAGAFVINAHLSVWFLLCVISVALFLASGKRRAELGVIQATPGVTRKSLSKYSKPLLDSYVTMFGNAAWMSWALFTFFESPPATLPIWLFLAEISKTTTINKLLMITIPIVIFGIMRYEKLIFEDRSEAPEKLLLTDISLMTAVAVWLALVVFILYGGISPFI